MVTYPITRFLIEYLRNDEGVFFAGMTISQNISVAALLGGAAATGSGSGRQPKGLYRDHAARSSVPHRPMLAMASARRSGASSGDRDVIEDAAEDVVGREALRRPPRS